jgi:hypothetical protein
MFPGVTAALTKTEVCAKAIEKAAELKEAVVKEVTKESVTLRPDIDAIKSKSLEAIEASNAKKVDIKDVSNVESVANQEVSDAEKITAAEVPDTEKVDATETTSDELRPISDKLKAQLEDDGILSNKAIDAIRIDADGNYVLDNCRNKELAGEKHPETGVAFVEKTIQVGSIQLKVVVPEFPAKFVLNIPKELWKKGDEVIFKYCTERLRDAIQANPELAKQFTKQQLEQIMNGEPYIKGLTWHHSAIPGRMELVDSKLHATTGHTGGNTIWCGGVR